MQVVKEGIEIPLVVRPMNKVGETKRKPLPPECIKNCHGTMGGRLHWVSGFLNDQFARFDVNLLCDWFACATSNNLQRKSYGTLQKQMLRMMAHYRSLLAQRTDLDLNLRAEE